MILSIYRLDPVYMLIHIQNSLSTSISIEGVNALCSAVDKIFNVKPQCEIKTAKKNFRIFKHLKKSLGFEKINSFTLIFRCFMFPNFNSANTTNMFAYTSRFYLVQQDAGCTFDKFNRNATNKLFRVSQNIEIIKGHLLLVSVRQMSIYPTANC